ncbi:DNase I-like protein [Sporormia fimetaria CBS 119925]|uniref:DNase I-like protein n=1 Tax=Sporormia fimetaria CBS 119925 TaxID=1340428 RepID=A0A6A6VA34_9PLEO|nr:DNase I-like protein [Sporormia fimetaria CBS 119925]
MSYPPPRSPTRRSPTKSPPKVLVQSPRSPPKTSPTRVHAPLPSRSHQHVFFDSPTSYGPGSGSTHGFKIPSRRQTPSSESHRGPLLQSSAIPSPGDPRKPSSPAVGPPHVPPPVNRAGKPKIFSTPKSQPAESASRETLAPEPVSELPEDRVSPFSTPPSSNGSAKDELSPTDPSPPKGPISKDSYFPSMKSRPNAGRLTPLDTRLKYQSSNRGALSPTRIGGDSAEDRPGIPPRPEGREMRRSAILSRSVAPEPPVRRSMDTARPAPTVSETNDRFMPPPRRTQTMATPEPVISRSLRAPKPPPPRNSGEMKRPIPSPAATSRNYDSDDAESPMDKAAPALTDYPDSSQANRRPPVFHDSPRDIPTKYETKLFAICGEYVCTTGYVTRVWSVLTGELLMSLSHGDTVKATAVAFRPAKDVEDEGKRLWLGTNMGEMHEIDIPTQSVVYTKSNAHSRTPIIKIFRYASEMWSLDEEGRIHIWSPDEHGSPTLTQTPNTFRVARGHSFSLIAGSQLWIAFGKEIRVYQRTSDHAHFQQVTPTSLSQPNAGEVTSGAILSSQPDRIYFGHIDGKVSIYAKKGFGCLGVVNVSLYKISSLVGVGDFLWAGYITGMVYVYDTRCTPWKVLKDWRAHESTIAGILADRTSIWKLDRLQVASLGTDNMLRIWDGMLRDDWLESQMHQKDVEYCDFREVSATVMTWNAGATKPTALRPDEQDRNFFRDLLRPEDPADILVFGFQELVDLEDKKVTAKSFFRKHKKKDASNQHEHMSHQYRAWRDHLVRVIEDYLPNDRYDLLHTADMVGLFSCVFVRSSERIRIRDVSAAQVKLGMGGLHGNKGALIVRFFMDDSSLCFINCHLAAGQTQTVHRNNDVATIMEAEALPRNRSPSDCTAFFVGGGDGSMILDHEICILNGDLNYRIDAMPRNTVIEAVRQGNLPKLLERDQLLLSKKRNPGFRLRAFNESPITFAPTYKYDVGTDNYDTSEKKRSPAWCDRLLYRGMGKIKQIEYRRHDGVRVSDHRPVSGRFKIRVKTISAKRQIMVKEQCEAEFEQVKLRIARDIKHDYLCNVFGLSVKEAETLLK